MVTKCYNLIIESERKPRARKILEEVYNRDYTAIKALPLEESPQSSNDSPRPTTILDPKCTKMKGRNQRIKNISRRRRRAAK